MVQIACDCEVKKNNLECERRSIRDQSCRCQYEAKDTIVTKEESVFRDSCLFDIGSDFVRTDAGSFSVQLRLCMPLGSFCSPSRECTSL